MQGAPAEAPRPRRALAVLAAAVLTGHLWLLHGLVPRGPRASAAPPALQVRTLPALRAATPSEVPREAPRRAVSPRAAPAPQAPPHEAPPAASARIPAPGTSTGDEPEPVPTYATRVPPSARLVYRLRRGAQAGQAILDWAHEGESYEARLVVEGDEGGLLLAQTSRGGFDAAGLAPRRHTDKRARQSLQAVNFQREAGKLSFSGPAIEIPLVPGAQDRLSWIVQLAAIAAAEPQRLQPGAAITLFVGGARGGAELWTLRVLEGGPQPRLERAPGRPYATRVEVELDAALDYWPRRLRLSWPPGGATLELEADDGVSRGRP